MFKRWNLLPIFLFVCCFAARASTVSTFCGNNSMTLTGANISSSSSCNGTVPLITAAASVSTSTSETTASVSVNFSPVSEATIADASASFTVDETWLFLDGTGSAELEFNGPNVNGLPPFLTMSILPLRLDPQADVVIDVGGLGIDDGNIGGIEAGRIIDFTFGVPFSFVSNVGLGVGNEDGDPGSGSIEYVTGTQTYTIPNANTVNECEICPNERSPWEISQPGGNFESATLIRTAVDIALPEPSSGGPLLVLLLAFALWRYRPAMSRGFAAFSCVWRR